MSRYAIEGMVWWVGDNVYIETEKTGYERFADRSLFE